MTSNTAALDARIHCLDVLRGFAISGVLFANILWLSGYLLALSSVQSRLLDKHFLDELCLFFTRLLVHGKFYAVFSLLFGLGFSVQLLRAQARQKPGFIAQYGRRLAILFLIGWVHAWFFWWGDILRFYAVLGAFLLILRHQSDRALLATALLALLTPILLPLGLPPLTEALPMQLSQRKTLEILAHGGWERFFELNWQRIQYHALSNIENGRVLKIFGLFVLGFYAGRRRIFHDTLVHQQLLQRTLIWGGVIGSLMSLIRVAPMYAVLPKVKSEVMEECLYLLSVYPLAFAYIAGITLACQNNKLGRLLRPLAPLGKMALSNYLLQTLLLTLVFYWWGFAMVGTLPLRYCYALVAVILVLQTTLSQFWLHRFSYGPVEWFWRVCTRLEWTPLRRPYVS